MIFEQPWGNAYSRLRIRTPIPHFRYHKNSSVLRGEEVPPTKTSKKNHDKWFQKYS